MVKKKTGQSGIDEAEQRSTERAVAQELPRRKITGNEDRKAAARASADIVFADLENIVGAMICQVKTGNAAMAKFLFEFANVKVAEETESNRSAKELWMELLLAKEARTVPEAE